VKITDIPSNKEFIEVREDLEQNRSRLILWPVPIAIII
jgi:hypothetical protein